MTEQGLLSNIINVNIFSKAPVFLLCTVLYLKPNISWILIQSLGKLPHNFSKYSCKPFKLILTHRWWFWPCLALEMPNLSKNHHFLTWIFKEILYLCNLTDFLVLTSRNCEEVSLMTELGIMKYLASNKVLCSGPYFSCKKTWFCE